MSKEAKFDFRAALLPVPHEGATRASALGEGDNVILANSKHPKEAFILLEFLYGKMPDVWNRFGFLPAARIQSNNPKIPAIYAVFEESMKYARNRGPHPEWPKISKAIYTAIQSSLTRKSDPKTALAAAQKQIDVVLKK